MRRLPLIVLAAWLLVGRPWPGVDAWENLEPMKRKPYRTREACEQELARRNGIARGVEGARCVSRVEFHGYKKTRQSEPFLE